MEGMREHGFVNVSTLRPREGLTMVITALEKCGKTHFALTAPKPMALFNLDRNLSEFLKKIKDEDKLQIEFYHMELPKVSKVSESDTLSHNDLKLNWIKFVEAYKHVLSLDEIRTVVIDTATDLWQYLRLVKFGKLKQVNKYEYDIVNAIFKNLIKKAEDTDKNLLLLHKMKAEWVNESKTGNYERAGYGEVGYLAQTEVQLSKGWEYDEDGEKGERLFKVEVKSCSHNPDLEGQSFEGDLCNFPMLSSLVLGE